MRQLYDRSNLGARWGLHDLVARLEKNRKGGISVVHEYHVAKTGSDWGLGTKEDPFLTISKAARVALPGDSITVHEGEYREWVRPKNKGLSDLRRITTGPGEKVVIKGSERIQSWVQVEGSIWKAVLPMHSLETSILTRGRSWRLARRNRSRCTKHLRGLSQWNVLL